MVRKQLIKKALIHMINVVFVLVSTPTFVYASSAEELEFIEAQLKGSKSFPNKPQRLNKKRDSRTGELRDVAKPLPYFRPLVSDDHRLGEQLKPTIKGRFPHPDEAYHMSREGLEKLVKAGVLVKYYRVEGKLFVKYLIKGPKGNVEFIHPSPTNQEVIDGSPRGLKALLQRAKKFGGHVAHRFLKDSAGFYIANNAVAFGTNQLKYFDSMEEPDYKAARDAFQNAEGQGTAMGVAWRLFETDRLLRMSAYADPAWALTQWEHAKSPEGMSHFALFIGINALVGQIGNQWIAKKEAFDALGRSTPASKITRRQGKLLRNGLNYGGMAVASIGASMIVESSKTGYHCTWPKIMSYIGYELKTEKEHYMLTECNRAYYDFMNSQTYHTWTIDTFTKLIPAAVMAAVLKGGATALVGGSMGLAGRTLMRTRVIGKGPVEVLNTAAAKRKMDGIKFLDFKAKGNLSPLQKKIYYPSMGQTALGNNTLRFVWEGFTRSKAGALIGKFKADVAPFLPQKWVPRGGGVVTFIALTASFANFVWWDKWFMWASRRTTSWSKGDDVDDQEESIIAELDNVRKYNFEDKDYWFSISKRANYSPSEYDDASYWGGNAGYSEENAYDSKYSLDSFKDSHIADKIYNYGRYQANWRDFLMMDSNDAHIKWLSYIERLIQRYTAGKYFYTKFFKDLQKYRQELKTKNYNDLEDDEKLIVDLFKPRKYNYLEGVAPSKVDFSHFERSAFMSPVLVNQEGQNSLGLNIPFFTVEPDKLIGQYSPVNTTSDSILENGEYKRPILPTGAQVVERMQEEANEIDDDKEWTVSDVLEILRERLFGPDPTKVNETPKPVEPAKPVVDNRPKVKAEHIVPYYSNEAPEAFTHVGSLLVDCDDYVQGVDKMKAKEKSKAENNKARCEHEKLQITKRLKAIQFDTKIYGQSEREILEGRRLTIEGALVMIEAALVKIQILEGDKNESVKDHSLLKKRLEVLREQLGVHMYSKYARKNNLWGKKAQQWSDKDAKYIQQYWDLGVSSIYKYVHNDSKSEELCLTKEKQQLEQRSPYYENVYCVWNTAYEMLGNPSLRGEQYFIKTDLVMQENEILSMSEDHYANVETPTYSSYLATLMACGPNPYDSSSDFVTRNEVKLATIRNSINKAFKVKRGNHWWFNDDVDGDGKEEGGEEKQVDTMDYIQDTLAINMDFWSPRVTEGLVDEKKNTNICDNKLQPNPMYDYLVTTGDSNQKNYYREKANPHLWYWKVNKKDENGRIKVRRYYHIVDMVIDNVSKNKYRATRPLWDTDKMHLAEDWWVQNLEGWYIHYMNVAQKMYEWVLEFGTFPSIFGPDNYLNSKVVPGKLWPSFVNKHQFKAAGFSRLQHYGVLDSVRLELNFYKNDILIPVITEGMPEEQKEAIANHINGYFDGLLKQVRTLMAFDKVAERAHAKNNALLFDLWGSFLVQYGFVEEAKELSPYVDPNSKVYLDQLKMYKEQLTGFDPDHLRGNIQTPEWYREKAALKKIQQAQMQMTQQMKLLALMEQAGGDEAANRAKEESKQKCKIVGVDMDSVEDLAEPPEKLKESMAKLNDKERKDLAKQCESKKAVSAYNAMVEAMQSTVKLNILQRQIVLETIKNITGVFVELSGYIDFVKYHNFLPDERE